MYDVFTEIVRVCPDAQDYPTESSYNEALDQYERAEVLCKRARQVIGWVAPKVQIEDDDMGMSFMPDGIRLDTVLLVKPTIAGERYVPGLALLVPHHYPGSYWEPPEVDYECKGTYLSVGEAVVDVLLLAEKDRLLAEIDAAAQRAEQEFLAGFQPDTPKYL